MADTVYEGMFIFDSNQYARDPSGTSGLVDQLVSSAGGELLASRLWEERRLAYPIKGQRKGTYWLTYFRVDGEQLGGMNRQCQINDSILRHLFLKVDPRLVDTLISHAKAGGTKAAAAAEVSAASAADDSDSDDDQDE